MTGEIGFRYKAGNGTSLAGREQLRLPFPFLLPELSYQIEIALPVPVYETQYLQDEHGLLIFESCPERLNLDQQFLRYILFESP